ncbi:MAG TPA: hypothetical protein VI299_10190, partial [Polyangiales bacterium]
WMLTALSPARGQEAPATEAPPVPPEAGNGQSACRAERFVQLSGESLDRALFDEVRTDLAAELAHRGIEVCDASATDREPAAVITLTHTDSTVVIELDDHVTHKRVGRDLEIARLPANGRALAIAIAIDELLRASWAELSLRRSTPEEEAEQSGSASSIVYRRTQVVNARGSVAPPLSLTLAGEVGYAHTVERFDAFSLGARLTMHAWQRGWFALGAGALSTIPVHTRLGDVLASGVRTTLTAGLCARDRRHTYGCGGARAEADYLVLRGVAPEDLARGRTKHAGVVQLSAVGMLALPVADSRTLFTELAVGAVLLGAEATDGSRVVMGVTGLMLGFNVGLEFAL